MHTATAQPHDRDLPQSTRLDDSPPQQTNAANLPHLLTVDEVAILLRTTRKAVYALIRKGTLPGVIRLSRRLLVDGSALVQWLD